jgi:hypothetical protein
MQCQTLRCRGLILLKLFMNLNVQLDLENEVYELNLDSALIAIQNKFRLQSFLFLDFLSSHLTGKLFSFVISKKRSLLLLR